MKRTLAMILVIVMVIGVFPATVFAAGEFKITLTSDVEDVSALDVGSKITVTANLENNPGFAGIVTNLVWDNTVVKFEGFTTETFRNQEYLVSEVIGDAIYNQTAGTVVVGEVENLTANGKLWEAVFTVLKGGETGIALNTDGQEFQMTNANKEKLTPVIDQTALAGLTVEHTCVYVETVVAPTCTEGGYTLHKCACGDEYRTANTPAAGHKYENNVCTVCGAPGTVIPEGAKFTDMLTDKGEIVTVTEKDGYYLVEVPYGTTSLLVTYPEELPKVDEFGFVTTRMVGFDGVSQDGYGITRKDGNIIVGLALEKAPSNGAPTVVRLINLDNEYSKRVAIVMADGSTETFALTYKLGNGQHFAVLPAPEECFGYTVTGKPIASDGYGFNVSILEGYEATANFAVKVNGETVATEPGDISIPSVTEDLKITVVGVEKIVENTDISVTFDLTDYVGNIDGTMSYMNQGYERNEVTLEAGMKATLSLAAADNMIFEVSASSFSSLVTHWEINGEKYSADASQDIGNFNTTRILISQGSLSMSIKTQEPATYVIKPIVATAESVGAAPAFAEDCIKVNDISVVGHDVVESSWDGDTLNVVLAEGTALDASVKTIWTTFVKNTQADATDARFYFNGSTMKAGAAEGTVENNMSTTLTDGVGTCEAAFTTKEHAKYAQFTPKTFTINFYVGEMPHIHDYESVVTPPTCTEGGYTTYTCKAGDDTYVAERVPALGHTNVNGTCSVCGAALTVIPEGAPFLDMMTNDGKPVIITEMGMDPYYGMGTLYKVEVPVGTIQVDITYKEGDVYVDDFSYAKTYVLDPSGYVLEDGYGQTTKDGKTTVGLQMEKAAANGISGTIYLLNTPYPADPYELTYAGLGKSDMSNIHFFAFTYKMEEGQYGVSLPNSFMYTVTGDPVATGSYTFNVAMKNGYEASETFAVKVNDEVVATEPGEITVDSVTEELIITVEGVKKIYNPETDISITVDLTEYTGEVDGFLSYSDRANNTYQSNLIPGKRNTVVMEASQVWSLQAYINSIGSDVVGYDINGEIRDPGYLSFGFVFRDNAQPGAYVIKPVLATPEQPSEPAAPGFPFLLKVDGVETKAVNTNTTEACVMGGDCGIIEVTVPADAKVLYAEFLHNAPDGVEIAPDDGETLLGGESFEVDLTAGYKMIDIYVPYSDQGSFAFHLYLKGAAPEQPSSNPITEIEVSHPNLVTDETTGAMSMAMVTGASEQIDVSTVLENAELDATQVVVWSSSDPETASVENGKVTAHKAGTVTITAKAVDASGIALAAEEDEVLAQFTLTVADPTDGYTVTMGEDVEAVVNNTVSVPVTIGHTGDVTKYNAFDLTFEYDPTVLELTSTKIDGMTVTVKDGKIHVERYGTDLTVGNTALTLTFKALTTGETNVKVTAAKVDISEAALTQDAPDASVIDNVTKVSVTGYTVSLPTEFKGESSVLPGENYTFEAKDKNYNYAFEGSTMNGETVSIKDNGDGTFTIENVTGDIVILTQPTGKTFTVTLGEDMTGETSAKYMTPYTATLNKADGYNYNVTVTINNVKFTGFTYDAATGLITIPGEAITGEIVFNSNKTAKTPDKHSVEFTGEYGDIAEGTLMEVDNGTNYILTINKVVGYKYTVTATMGGETVEVKDNGDGTYTIKNVTGDLVITIAKEYDLAVNVDEYVKLNGKVMFLVTATATVDEGKVLSYNGTAMFWSNQYNAWSFLVITEGTLSVDDAKNLITLNEGTKVELDQTYNVNESVSGTVDINDAQLVFDMYNNKYQDFTNNATMQKFLKADVNGDKTINTGDAAAVVSEIVKNK